MLRDTGGRAYCVTQRGKSNKEDPDSAPEMLTEYKKGANPINQRDLIYNLLMGMSHGPNVPRAEWINVLDLQEQNNDDENANLYWVFTLC